MARRLAVLVAMLAMVLAAAVPASAQQQGEETSVTGVLENLGPASEGCASIYGIFGGEEIKGYYYLEGDADFDSLVGQTVTAYGTLAVGDQGQTILNVSSIGTGPVDGTTGPSQQDRTATLSFEVTTDCAPPEGTTLLGFVPAEGGISVGLGDFDGDGVYTGSVEVPRFAPGPAPEGTEPVSVPVQIGQNVGDDSGNVEMVKDFGQVKLDGDKTFSADASFCAGGTGQYGSGETTGAIGETTGIVGGTTGPAAGGQQYEDGGTAAVAGIDLNEDGTVSQADDKFAAETSERGVTTTPQEGVLPSTGGLVLPVAGLVGALLMSGGLLLRRKRSVR